MGKMRYDSRGRAGREMDNVYRFAEVNVRVSCADPAVHTFCSAYASGGPADFTVEAGQKEIDFERSRVSYADCSDAYLENLAVCRGIAENMPRFGAFLFHGSAIAVDGAAYLFAAKSGVGKSTHTRLWRELLGGRAEMVNDDKPFIRVHPDGKATVYGSPWRGKHRLGQNIAVPVRAVCLLERAPDNWIRPVEKRDALPALVRQAYRPISPAALEQTLTLLDQLDVKLFRLGCNMDPEAAELSYNAMKEG